MELNAAAVIPLYASVKLLAILKDQHHRSPVVHLLLVIEALGVGLFGRHSLSVGIRGTSAIRLIAIVPLPYFSQCCSYQFSVHHTSLQERKLFSNGSRASLTDQPAVSVSSTRAERGASNSSPVLRNYVV